MREIFICQNRQDKIKTIIGAWEKVAELDNRLWTNPILLGMKHKNFELDKRYLKAALKNIEKQKGNIISDTYRKEEDKDGHVRFYDQNGYKTHEHCPNGPECCGGIK